MASQDDGQMLQRTEHLPHRDGHRRQWLTDNCHAYALKLQGHSGTNSDAVGPCALHGIDAGWLQLLERAAQGCATACALKLASSRIVCLCTDAVVDPRLTKQLRPAAAVSLRSLSARVLM